MKTRRSFLGHTFAAALALSAGCAALTVSAQAADVKVAVIAPMSGPWARQGELMKKGAELAIADINAAGGIKALGGAKLQLLIFDAGDSAEKAKNAAQRMVSSEPDLVGGTGAWLSSFTLAVTEVTERAELPILTLSYSDQITNRGHKFVFQTSPTAGAQAKATTPALIDLAAKTMGKKPSTIAIVQDNTASPMSFSKPLREGGLEKLGLKLVVDQIFTPPLSDATAIVQQLRSSRPNMMYLIPTNVPDLKLLLEKMNEFGLAKGRIPMMANGAPMGTPELLKNVGKDLVEGLMFSVANWPAKGQEQLIERFKKATGEPWMTQDSLCSYGDMWIFKEALEIAGKADRKAVAEALRKMDFKDGKGPAAFYPGGRVKFDEAGRRVDAALVIAQWQNAVPVTVFPEASALSKPNFPAK